VALSVVVQCQLFAATVKLPTELTSSFADNVSVYDSKLPAERFDKTRSINLNIKLLSSVTNSISLRLGRDGRFGLMDGLLSIEESFFELGIDCNQFCLRKNRFKEKYIHVPASPGVARDRTFTMKMRVAPDNPAAVRSVIFSEEGTPFVFDGLQLDPYPIDLNPVMWTDLRLLVRNGGTQSVKVQYLKDGALIIVR
jgi:hypothetical protein